MRTLIGRLSRIKNLSDFREVLAAHNILDPNERFMHIETDISNQCNLRCVMCYFSFDAYFHRTPIYLSPAVFSRLAEALFSYAHTLTLSLGSEPLMSPHFVPILQIASRYEIPNITFFTNGLLLNDHLIDAIIRYGVTHICVSIDGATKKSYETIRRGANLDRLLRAIQALVAKRNSTGRSTPRLRFDVVLMKRNICELEDIVTLASRSGAEELNLSHVVVYEGLGMESESLVHHKTLSNYWLSRALEKATSLGLTVVGHPKPFCLDAPDEPQEDSGTAPLFRTTPYCPYPFFHVSLNSEGHILACPFSHGESRFGLLLPDVSFEQIWFGTPFTTLRRRILENDPPPMCRRCSYLSIKNPDVAGLFAPRSP